MAANKEDKEGYPSFDVLETSSKILENYGKSDEEIREFLEQQFPITSEIMDKIFEVRKAIRQKERQNSGDAKRTGAK